MKTNVHFTIFRQHDIVARIIAAIDR